MLQVIAQVVYSDGLRTVGERKVEMRYEQVLNEKRHLGALIQNYSEEEVGENRSEADN